MITGLPLSGILLAMVFSLNKGLKKEYDRVYQ
jgi:choline-glycine betaine transporter